MATNAPTRTRICQLRLSSAFFPFVTKADYTALLLCTEATPEIRIGAVLA